ncbi:hypothetical protein [Streptomyces sp. NPDC005970]|uniref:hypothetical protein n=1 Tax=Streptomyces sp. NPDC005970 TaxID=3156723 RepID=UPI0033ED50E7
MAEHMGPVTLTTHPVQRAGAWAVAVLAGRGAPEEVSRADLEKVVGRVVEDVCAAAVAGKDTPAYDWWKVLFSQYPNSKATHSKRSRNRDVLRPEVEGLFAPDSMTDVPSAVYGCTFCGRLASVVWTKTVLPMFDTSKALNTLPPRVAGWPVCWGCRVAAWALPYGAWVTAGSATVLTCEEPSAERVFAARMVQRAQRVIQAGFASLPATAHPERVVAMALRRLGPGLPSTAVLWTFKNDNQEPWLRVTRTRRATSRFLAVVDGRAPVRAGWHLLEEALTVRDRVGTVVTNGREAVARLLFEAEDGQSRSLLSQVYRVLEGRTDDWSPHEREALAGLAFTYAKEVLGMEPKLTAVATLLADWIEHGSASSRGKFAEYRKVALNDYQLGALLMQAQSRLLLDGHTPAAGPDDWAAVIGQRPRVWEQRMLLFAAVMQQLAQRGVAVSQKVPADEDDQIEQLVKQPILQADEDDFEEGAA